jgi:SP family myo-inositol transporter-like MFS transporter 13
VRARAMSLAVAVNWLANLAASLTFLSLSEALGSVGVFALYLTVGFGALAFCYLCVPETLGITPEELLEKMRRR